MNSESQAKVAYYMTIVLTVLQFITIIALILLWTVVRELKKNVNTHKHSIPLVNITNSLPGFTVENASSPGLSPPAYPDPGLSPPTSAFLKPDPSPSASVKNFESSGSIVGNKQKPEKDEVIVVMPTPDPERSNRITQSSTVTKATKSARDSIGNTSLTDSSRDSGLGYTSDRNRSTSSESLKDAISKSRDSYPVLSEKVSVNEETRTESNASRESSGSGNKRYSFHDYHNALHLLQYTGNSAVNTDKYAGPNKPSIDDNDDDCDDEDDYRHLERLQTMAIEMIDIDSKTAARDKRKRASQILNEQALQAFNDGRVGFVNRGYSDASVTSQPRAPLASEECSLSSDAHNVDENENEIIEDEVYENQEIVEKHRMSVKTAVQSGQTLDK